MQKIIFLDFDGVITTMATRYALCPHKCNLLQQIIDRTGAKIVVSSSWRSKDAASTIAELNDTSCFLHPFIPSWVNEIIGVTIRAYNYIERGVHLGIPRGVEIKQWIDTNIHRDQNGGYQRKQVGVDYQYVILDDDIDMLLEHAEHFIHTDTYLGLSQSDAVRAVCVLNGCSPEEVKDIMDTSPYHTFEEADAMAMELCRKDYLKQKKS